MRIKFFASLREAVGQSDLYIDHNSPTLTVADVIDHLISLHPEWNAILKDQTLMTAVNQEMAQLTSPVKPDDEIAFFPPVTGG